MSAAYDEEDRRMLPRELVWVYLFAPFLVTPIIVHDLFEQPLIRIVREVAASYVPFLVIPIALHAFYRHVMARLAAHRERPLTVVVAQLVGVTLVAMACAWLLIPAYRIVSGRGASLRGFVFNCVVISWVTMIPAALVQRLRRHARVIERQAHAERQAALEAQLRALQARTNPHFFFNSINTVASLIPEDPQLAEETLERLAELFRYALDSGERRLVPLRRELEIARDYLAIQAVRFGDRLRVDVVAEPTALDHLVPPLLLQPVLENAVLHGISGRASGGTVRVRAYRRVDQLVVVVEDDGPGPGRSAHRGTGTSMRELRERLRIVFGEAASVDVDTSDAGGCRVTIAVPWRSS